MKALVDTLRVGCGFALVALFAACGETKTPSEVYAEYLDGLARGDLEAAFDLLYGGSRERLARAEDAWARADTGDPLVPEGEAFPKPAGQAGFRLFTRLVIGPGATGIPPVPADASRRLGGFTVDGDHARVAVTTSKGPDSALLVRENGTWRVALDLP